MKKQLAFSLISDEPAQAKTKKKAFLEEMERIMPIDEWVEMIRPCYYKDKKINQQKTVTDKEIIQKRTVSGKESRTQKILGKSKG